MTGSYITYPPNDRVIGGGDSVEDAVAGLERKWGLEGYLLLLGNVIVTQRPTHATADREIRELDTPCRKLFQY